MSDRRIVALAAFVLPALAFLLHRDTGHLGDIEFFHDWYLAFREGAGFYRNGPGLNYPILGVLLVCGPATLLEGVIGDGIALTLDQYTLVLKVTLALAETALIASLAGLLRRIGVRPLWALAIYLCPSTWAPGAWFGQIDVWTSVALVVAFIGVLDYRREPTRASLGITLGGFWAALLIKQLAWFTLPAIGIALLFALRRAPYRHAFAALLSGLVLFVADPFLELPNGWHSHVAWVWFGGGSSHADLIVAGGASLWSLIADVNVSAHGWRALGLSAYQWGLILFALTQVHLLRMLRASHRASRVEPEERPSRGDVAFLRYAALSNLAMCIVLTGVHERYFVHGSIFLLVAAFAEPRWLRVLSWIVCMWWGLFVLGSVHFDAFAGWPFRWHVPAAVGMLVLALAWGAPRRLPNIPTTRSVVA